MARSTITRVTCDGCGCLVRDGMHGTLDVETQWEEPEQVDLCVLCLTKGVQTWLKEISREGRQAWLERIRRQPSV